jgi:hypothetical protein
VRYNGYIGKNCGWLKVAEFGVVDGVEIIKILVLVVGYDVIAVVFVVVNGMVGAPFHNKTRLLHKRLLFV